MTLQSTQSAVDSLLSGALNELVCRYMSGAVSEFLYRVPRLERIIVTVSRLMRLELDLMFREAKWTRYVTLLEKAVWPAEQYANACASNLNNQLVERRRGISRPTRKPSCGRALLSPSSCSCPKRSKSSVIVDHKAPHSKHT